MGEERNPYRDPNTGRYVNALGTIGSYTALTEQDIQIMRNQEIVDSLNGKKPLNRGFYRSARESYDATREFLERDKDYIPKNFDYSNIPSTIDLVDSTYKKVTGESLTPACYNTVGTLSAIFDSQKTPYSAWAGVGAADENALNYHITGARDGYFNHVWVRQGNNVFDTFNNHKLQETLQAPRIYIEVKEFRFR